MPGTKLERGCTKTWYKSGQFRIHSVNHHGCFDVFLKIRIIDRESMMTLRAIVRFSLFSRLWEMCSFHTLSYGSPFQNLKGATTFWTYYFECSHIWERGGFEPLPQGFLPVHRIQYRGSTLHRKPRALPIFGVRDKCQTAVPPAP